MCQQIDTLQDVNFSKVLLLLSACEEVRKGFLLRILNFTQVKIGHEVTQPAKKLLKLLDMV